jgi:hypothetical protein
MYSTLFNNLHLSEDAGIETRTDATLPLGSIASTTQLYLIHTRLHLIHNSATSHPQLGYISSTTRLHTTHHRATSHPRSATSHPQLGSISSTTRLHLIHNSTTTRPPLGYIPSSSRLYLFFHSRLHLIQNKIKFQTRESRRILQVCIQ